MEHLGESAHLWRHRAREPTTLMHEEGLCARELTELRRQRATQGGVVDLETPDVAQAVHVHARKAAADACAGDVQLCQSSQLTQVGECARELRIGGE